MLARNTAAALDVLAAAKSLDENAVLLAVIAHIRHRKTNYDDLLGKGWERSDARSAVAERIDEVLGSWKAEEGRKDVSARNRD